MVCCPVGYINRIIPWYITVCWDLGYLCWTICLSASHSLAADSDPVPVDQTTTLLLSPLSYTDPIHHYWAACRKKTLITAKEKHLAVGIKMPQDSARAKTTFNYALGHWTWIVYSTCMHIQFSCMDISNPSSLKFTRIEVQRSLSWWIVWNEDVKRTGMWCDVTHAVRLISFSLLNNGDVKRLVSTISVLAPLLENPHGRSVWKSIICVPKNRIKGAFIWAWEIAYGE